MKKILLGIIVTVFVVLSFVTGFNYCKKQIISGSNQVIKKDIKHIAIVNLDEGIMAESGKKVYSGQLLKFANEYNRVGLNEARKGIESGMYAAYILIPSDFSKCIESINAVPQKVKVDYVVNPNLTDKNRLEIEEKLNSFKEILNSNVAYIYLCSILEEFHNVQDSASLIMEHDNSDLNNIQNIDPDAIFTMIEFSEMKPCDNEIKDVDLTDYVNKNSTEMDNITSAIDKGIMQGKKEYEEISKEYNSITKKMADIETQMSEYNPLKDENENEVYGKGVEELTVIIDEYNSKIDSETEEDTDEIKKILRVVTEQNLTNILNEAQKNTDSQLKTIQEQNKQIIDTGRTDFNEKNNTYYDNLNAFIKNTMNQHVESGNTTLTELESNLSEKNTAISELKQETFTKEEVLNLINEIAMADKTTVTALTDQLESSELFDGYHEEKIPQLTADDIVLPKVKEVYMGTDTEGKEEDTNNSTDSTEEEDSKNDNSRESTEEEKNEDDNSGGSTEEGKNETEGKTVSINISGNIDTNKGIEGSIENQSENIENCLNNVNRDYKIPKDEISTIIDEQIIGKILEENQKKATNFSKAKDDVLAEINKYDTKVTDFNPYNYLKKDDLSKYINTMNKNILELGKAMNQKNSEYLAFVHKVYQVANENINTLQKDMQKANGTSKKKLGGVIEKLKSDKKNIAQEDNNILEDFSKKLPYSRLGSLEYTDMYKFMINPIETMMQLEGEKVEEKKETQVQLNYTWIVIGMVVIVVIFLICNTFIKITKERKALKAMEDE